MKKIGIIIFIVALAVGLIFANIFSFGRATDRLFNLSVNFCGVKGSGNITTESRDVTDFNAVDVGGVFQVEVTAQKDFAVEVEADDNLLPYITTEVDGNVLKIQTDRRITATGPIHVRISAPDIENLDVSGAANVTLNGVDNDSLSVDSSGASKVQLNGETQKLTVEVSGATKVDAEALKAGDADIDSSGASHVNVNASGEINADASGASKVVYTGSPVSVQKKTSGGASVTRK